MAISSMGRQAADSSSELGHTIAGHSNLAGEHLASGRGLERAKAAAQAAADNRGRDVVILDLREITPVFDYFVLATGTSARQLHAMSEEIDRKLEKELGDRRMGIEGYQESRWILLDYGDVVVHLFDAETRGYYDLESLWAGAKHVPFTPVEQAPSPFPAR